MLLHVLILVINKKNIYNVYDSSNSDSDRRERMNVFCFLNGKAFNKLLNYVIHIEVCTSEQ